MNTLGFPEQPTDTPWPRENWLIANNAEAMGIDVETATRAIDELFVHGIEPPEGRGTSLALVVVHRGRIVFERYGVQPGNDFHEARDISSETPLISWSMAKSITHALIGILVGEGRIDVSECVAVAEWKDDARRTITWTDLLRMRDGLDFVEDYVVHQPVDHQRGDHEAIDLESGRSRSDVIEMLFGSGTDDVFAYARSRPLARVPGTSWSYSSGTTNILCGLVGDLLGGRAGVEAFLRERVFDPLGMSSADPTFDAAGTFVGSSYVHATARDFARFGYLYLRGGTFADQRILSESWVDGARRQHAVDPENGHGYGEHWWTWNADGRTLAALGYEGQRTIVSADRDLVVVHLGKWETSTQPFLDRMLTRLIEAVPPVEVSNP